jgi:uncharacterized protein YbjT (DUF2867 family)
MKAFVAGATGYTGREVVRELAQRGADVVAHVRPDSPRLAEWQRRFETNGAQADASLWQIDALEAAFARYNPTHIFALLGTTRARAREAAKAGRDESYSSVDYELTSILINAARTCAPAAHFIYLSSIGVDGVTRSSFLDVRRRLEAELKESGLHYVIARPAFISGADREEFRFGERVGASITKVVLTIADAVGIKALSRRFKTMSGKQLARALVNAAFDEQCVDRTLDVAGLHALVRL